MCDSIANGGYIPPAEKCCPPANVIIASNVLDTNGNIICGNIISQDGTFTGNLYVSGNIVSNIVYVNLNIAGVINTSSIVSGAYYGNGSGLANLNAANLFGIISSSNLPTTTVVPGTYGSSANVFQGTIDQYGRVTQAANISILSSQWTTIDGNVAYQNGVSIGTLSNPPIGSNLYVLGTANISTLNVDFLTVNSAIVYGTSTLNVYGISNLNSVIGNSFTGNGSGLSNLNGSNVTGTVGTAVAVTGNAQPNITSVGTLTGLNVQGLLVASNGSAISNLNSSNIVGAVGTAVAVTGNAQPNITSVGTLTDLNVQGLLVASNGSAISNLNSSNIVGTVGTAVAVTGNAQPNITSVGVLSSLSVSGVLSAGFLTGNASGLSNLRAANVIGTVATAQAVTASNQPNITSVGIMTLLRVTGRVTAGSFQGDGSLLTSLSAGNVVGNVAYSNLALYVSSSAQPNITSVGTLTSLQVSGGVTAGSFAGDAAGLSNIQVSNITGTVPFATTAGVVTQAAQPNITSVGALTSLSVIGTMSAGTFVGDGYGVTGVRASTLIGSVPLAAAVSGNAQPNITSVGTLSSLTVSGLIVGSGQALSSLRGANVVGTVGTAGAVTGNAQPNITSIGTLSSLSVSGALSAGLLTGNASGLSNLRASNIIGTVPLAVAVTGNAQPNITSVGLLSNVAVSNSVTTTNVFATFANVSGTGIFGSVGIGTASPFGPFEISSPLPNQTVSVYLSDGATGLGDGSAIIKDPFQNLFIENYQNADIIIAASGTNRMRMYAPGGQAILSPLGVGPTLTNPLGSGATLQVTGNIYASNALTAPNLIVPTANILSLNVSTDANVTNLTVFQQATTTNFIVEGALTSNAANTTFLYDTLTIPFINTAILGSNIINVFFLNVYSISNLNSIVTNTANIGALNVITISNLNSLTTNLIAPTANIGNLNVFQVSNLQNLTLSNSLTAVNVFATTYRGDGGLLSNINSSPGFLPNLVVSNSVTTTNVFFQNAILNTNLPTFSGAQGTWGSSANVSQVTVDQYGRVSAASNVAITSSQWMTVGSNIAYQNGVSIGTLNSPPTGSNLYVPGTISVGTLNVSSLATNLVATTANVGTLNVWQISNLQSLSVPTANVGTLNVITISNLNSLTTNLTSTTANVGTLNVWQISNLQSLSVPTANVGTLNVLAISNLNSLMTNLTATTANVGTLNVWQISNLQSLSVPTANVGTLNVSAIENVTQLNAGNVSVTNTVTVSNLTVTSNILPYNTAGNTYVVGNVVVSGNVYSSLGELGVGGSLMFTLGTTLTPAIQYTGTVPVAGTTTYGLSMTPFTRQGTSTFIKVSANGCFQFNQTGVYKASGIFMTNSNNVLGIGIGSNVIDYGTRTDQSYLYSLVPFVSQNPTSVLETQFYVSSTSLYYYIDLFSIDSIILQPTSNLSGGTWVSISPLGGISAASTTVTLSTLGDIVTNKSTSYGAQITDYYIGVNGTGVTITLPPGNTLAAGKTYVIKDESGAAAANHIILAPTSPDLIDKQSSLTLVVNFLATTVLWTGTTWSII
jgi:hypothetical protein